MVVSNSKSQIKKLVNQKLSEKRKPTFEHSPTRKRTIKVEIPGIESKPVKTLHRSFATPAKKYVESSPIKKLSPPRRSPVRLKRPQNLFSYTHLTLPTNREV